VPAKHATAIFEIAVVSLFVLGAITVVICAFWTPGWRKSNSKNSGKTEFFYHREDRLLGRVNSRQAHLCLSRPSSIPCQAAIRFVNS
jgi:hypothetical protein